MRRSIVFPAAAALTALELAAALPEMWRSDAPAAVLEREGRIALVNLGTEPWRGEVRLADGTALTLAVAPGTSSGKR